MGEKIKESKHREEKRTTKIGKIVDCISLLGFLIRKFHETFCVLCFRDGPLQADAKIHIQNLNKKTDGKWEIEATIILVVLEKRHEALNSECELILYARKLLQERFQILGTLDNKDSLNSGGVPWERETDRDYNVVVTIAQRCE